jgi:hypothetical protein
MLSNLNFAYLIKVWDTVHLGIFTKTFHLVTNRSYNDFYLINERSQNMYVPYIQAFINLTVVPSVFPNPVKENKKMLKGAVSNFYCAR